MMTDDELAGFKSLEKIYDGFKLTFERSYERKICTVNFGRIERNLPFGWVGPAADLERKGEESCESLITEKRLEDFYSNLPEYCKEPGTICM